ncbi:hypothetical protein K439DRAFT_1317768, partial [Ramaria rubella]
ARVKASQTRDYDSTKTRADLLRLFQTRCGGKEPYPWQLDVTEALLLGLDSVVFAGTGAGKTIPFVMPLWQDTSRKKMVI